MHPRNIYVGAKHDFDELTSFCPGLAKHLKRREDGSLGFKFDGRDAVFALTRALLQKDFNLTLTLPPHCLVPTVPQKLNYIHWIEDLLGGHYAVQGKIRGIDIGTGASCIYPLLGCRLHGNWQFVATELNKESFESARANVISNDLGDRINVVHNTAGADSILKNVVEFTENVKQHDFDFVMCNPPFFDVGETPGNRTGKRKDGVVECPGIDQEMVTVGGEVGFARRMIADTLILQQHVQWYTTMLGKRSSLDIIVTDLKRQGFTFRTTVFEQGRTHRWAVAWSVDKSAAAHLPMAAATTSTVKKSKKSKKSAKKTREIIIKMGTQDAVEFVASAFGNMAGCTALQVDSNCLHLRATLPSWIGRRRKKRLKLQSNIEAQNNAPENNEVPVQTTNILEVKIYFSCSELETETTASLSLDGVGSIEYLHQVYLYLVTELGSSGPTELGS